jgi:hypothetical protein
LKKTFGPAPPADGRAAIDHETKLMIPKESFKSAFTLAVRLVGLYFICLGLRGLDVPAFTDVTLLKSDTVDDVITTLLPVVYNLAIGWWLLGCTFLSRRAYRESFKTSDRCPPPQEPVTPASAPAQPQGLTGMQAVEKKLAALVGKSKDDPAAQ